MALGKPGCSRWKVVEMIIGLMTSHHAKRLGLIAVVVGCFIALIAAPGGAVDGEAGLTDPDILTIHDGDYNARTDGEVIENLEIRGTLRVAADNVRVRNVWVYSSGSWTVYVESGSAMFENMEIGHPDVVGQRGIGGDNLVARNLDIHSVEDGIKIGTNVFYDNIRVHDLDSLSASPHADAVQADGGANNVLITNSYLDSTGPLANGNASVILKSDLGPLDDITFSNNYLNGGNYTVFVRDGGNGMPTNILFTDNRIGPDRTYGIVSDDGPFGWQNNFLEETSMFVDVDGNPTTGTTAAPTDSTVAGPTTTVASATTTEPQDGTTTSSAPSALGVPPGGGDSFPLATTLIAVIAAVLLGAVVMVGVRARNSS